MAIFILKFENPADVAWTKMSQWTQRNTKQSGSKLKAGSRAVSGSGTFSDTTP